MPWSRRSERQYGMDGSTYPVSMSKICCAGSHFVKSRLSPLGGATIRQSDARWVAPRRRLGFKILALPIVQTVQQHPRDHIAMAQRLLRLDSTALSPLVRLWTQQSGINTLNRVYSRTVPLGIERLPRKCSMLPELRIGRYVLWTDSSGQEESNRQEEAYLLQGRTPFDGAFSGLPSGAGLETDSCLPRYGAQHS
jgi:hypothetical protein